MRGKHVASSLDTYIRNIGICVHVNNPVVLQQPSVSIQKGTRVWCNLLTSFDIELSQRIAYVPVRIQLDQLSGSTTAIFIYLFAQKIEFDRRHAADKRYAIIRVDMITKEKQFSDMDLRLTLLVSVLLSHGNQASLVRDEMLSHLDAQTQPSSNRTLCHEQPQRSNTPKSQPRQGSFRLSSS